MNLNIIARSALPILLGWMCLAFVCGCVTTQVGGRHGDPLRPGDLPEDPSPQGQTSSANAPARFSPDVLTAKDQCPARLQDIAGALLMYYHLHHSFPNKLAELASVTDIPPLVCPDSQQPYSYSPSGLHKPGGNNRIIVYDPIRNGDGTRWCIMAIYGKPGTAQDLQVIQLPEPLFLAYQ